jgi:AmmeMemoRadiSam system protein A
MSSPDVVISEPLGRVLLEVALESIRCGLRQGEPLRPDAGEFAPELREPRASFVTLHYRGELRGCTGTLEPRRPLVNDVAENAYRSAFGDPRFPALCEVELVSLEVQLSILGPLERLHVDSETALLAALLAKVDGLVLREGALRATFLPAVWEELPDPREFVAELKRKAGLSRSYWSSSLVFERYTVQSVKR